jgi:hypothetical protein
LQGCRAVAIIAANAVRYRLFLPEPSRFCKRRRRPSQFTGGSAPRRFL